MALHTRLRNTGGGMVRVCCLLKVGEMAGYALRRQPRKLPAGMALCALGAHMRAGQGELGHGVVIELGIKPARGAVAGGALL